MSDVPINKTTSIPGTSDAESPLDVFVARQPILNKKMEVYGYELLYRSGMRNSFDGTDSVQATSDVITASFLNIGIERLVGPGRAFINFDRDLLLTAVPESLPPGRVVIELLETIEVDEAVVSKCRKLKKNGFQIALDDFSFQHQFERLIPLADIIKIDFRQTDALEQKKLAAEFGRRGIRVLAEKVESPEEYHSASTMDYAYFQGYFFAYPTTVHSSRVSPNRGMHLRLLQETTQAELDFSRVEALLKTEPALTSQLLRYLNSALFSWNDRIHSIVHALMLLGTEGFRKWAAIVTLCGMAQDRPRALIACSVIRARFCELIGVKAGLANRSSELFMMGLFSLLDAILNQPLNVILADLHLAADLVDVIVGTRKQNTLSRIYAMARAFERADWPTISAMSIALGITEADLAAAYFEAVQWANNICP